jgi:hypothetical protein
MRRLLLTFILALAATCAVSLTVPTDPDRQRNNSGAIEQVAKDLFGAAPLRIEARKS